MRELTIQNPDDPIEVAVKNNLEEGMVVKEFSELCRLSGIQLKAGGRQRDLAKTTLSHYVDFTEIIPEGRKRKNYIINEIYEEPRLQIFRGGKYRDRLILVLYSFLAGKGSATSPISITMDFDELAETVGFIKPMFKDLLPLRDGYTNPESELPESVKVISTRHLGDFIATCRSTYKEYFRGVLNVMARMGMIRSYNENYWLTMLDGKERWAEDWESDIINQLYEVYIHMPLHFMKTADQRKALHTLMRAINTEREQHYAECEENEQIPNLEVLRFYRKLLINYNKDELKSNAESNGTVLLDAEQCTSIKRELSDLFVDTLKSRFKHKYEKIIRDEHRAVQMRSEHLAFGDISDQTPYAFIYDNYIDNMNLLIDYTIRRD